MGHTPIVAIVILHGAGSTGAAALHLLGLAEQPDRGGLADPPGLHNVAAVDVVAVDGVAVDVITVEDRSGDLDAIVQHLDSVVTSIGDCTEIIGISLGAHALITWASGRKDCPPLTCVLPAWIGDPSWGTPFSGAAATAHAAEDIARSGIQAALEALPADPALGDIAALVRMAWADYSDAQLEACLTYAARAHGPTTEQLAAVAGSVRVLGWYGDAFHPAPVAIAWSRLIPHARVAMAARPSIRLLGQARASLSWPAVPPTRLPGADA